MCDTLAPAALEPVVRQCLAKDPALRYRTARDLHDDPHLGSLRYFVELPHLEVGVRDGLGVALWVAVGEAVGVCVIVGVRVGVRVGVIVGVFVGVRVGVCVGVFVTVGGRIERRLDGRIDRRGLDQIFTFWSSVPPRTAFAAVSASARRPSSSASADA